MGIGLVLLELILGKAQTTTLSTHPLIELLPLVVVVIHYITPERLLRVRPIGLNTHVALRMDISCCATALRYLNLI